MKRIYSIILISLLGVSIKACPPPTAHVVVNVGAAYDYSLKNKINSKDNLGINGKIGCELPNRYVTISGVGGYVFGYKSWSVGGEIAINPLGIRYGYDTPINFSILCGVGYGNSSKIYTNFGLEISGRMGNFVTPYAKCTFNMENLGNGMNKTLTASVGLRLWLGRDW